uniref:Uncharacterized protein n=1 Tax=Anguilla anguilla TaxID=7936 RepID=A0A0E9PQF9_ANGAN
MQQYVIETSLFKLISMLPTRAILDGRDRTVM